VALIAGGGDDPLEGLVDQGDLRVEDVAEAEHDRHGHSAVLDAPEDLQQADGPAGPVGAELDLHLSGVGDVEIGSAPVLDAVQLARVLDRPSGKGGFVGHVSGSPWVVG
jgi:hypothetical protein